MGACRRNGVNHRAQLTLANTPVARGWFCAAGDSCSLAGAAAAGRAPAQARGMHPPRVRVSFLVGMLSHASPLWTTSRVHHRPAAAGAMKVPTNRKHLCRNELNFHNRGVAAELD
jgi:hypothetical protein